VTSGGTTGIRRQATVAAALLLALAAFVAAQQLSSESAGAAPVAKAAKKKGGVGIRVVSKTFNLSTADDAQRYETICPKGKFPYGGGIKTDPAPANGAGVYPNSYERLGVQHGYHINGTLVDFNGGQPAGRQVTIQAFCGSKPGNITPPHRTVFVQPGETKTLTMSCGKRKLMGGGYQRTTGRSKDGNLITQSRAAGNAWQVTSRGQGKFGGELTGIAYCLKGTGGKLIKEVKSTVPIGMRETATATTPRCPKGRRIAFGGFDVASDSTFFYFGGYVTTGGTWAATGYNSGAPTTLTAYAYCIRPFNK
jgi:hypothetical protein